MQSVFRTRILIGVLAALGVSSAAVFQSAAAIKIVRQYVTETAAAADRQAQRDAGLRKMEDDFRRHREALRQKSSAPVGDERKTGRTR